MAAAQQNERKSTRFDGVYQRPSRTKRYEGKPDVTYTIDYCDPHTGKRVRKAIGNRSDGITAEYANSVRQTLMSTAKKEVLEGIMPQTGKSVPTFGQAWLRYKTDWLEANEKAGILEIIGKLTDKKIDLVESTDEKLLGGFVINIDDFQVDQSIAAKIKGLKKDFEKNLFVKGF